MRPPVFAKTELLAAVAVVIAKHFVVARHGACPFGPNMRARTAAPRRIGCRVASALLSERDIR